MLMQQEDKNKCDKPQNILPFSYDCLSSTLILFLEENISSIFIEQPKPFFLSFFSLSILYLYIFYILIFPSYHQWTPHITPHLYIKTISVNIAKGL